MEQNAPASGSAAALNVLEVVERHGAVIGSQIAQMFGEIRDALAGDSSSASRPQPKASPAPEALWREVERRVGETYKWPTEHGDLEEYDPFVVYSADGLTLALAQNVGPVMVKDKWRKQVWVFRIGAGGGSKRPIMPFVQADDYEQTRELVALIRGKGDSGRGMFGPGDSLPAAYEGMRVENFGARIAGHYNKYCVVAHEDDVKAMLDHGAAQVRLRGL